MNESSLKRLSLEDSPNTLGRTTENLIASLSARLASLHYVTGATTVGSIISGYAKLGREISRTSEGARMRKTLEASRVGSNANLLWTSLGISEWASEHPPCPILDQFRNDVAILLADDLEECLLHKTIPIHPIETIEEEKEPVNPIDYILGLWIFSKELAQAIEALAAKIPEFRLIAARTDRMTQPLEGSILR